ncbi:uncharacterized protein LOC120058571 isoform X2 [Salvelinus namaycush]|uniref:Uncharacterized protein LOC120058571 isoform X2 n=1 Tax=Salvelinus namaycush TaxID=8040 RepID=A0A8U1BZU3_SALNM|nr:uncharacterized protein LOC120058571 isoform X2 [Salvelinus namaycush]
MAEFRRWSSADSAAGTISESYFAPLWVSQVGHILRESVPALSVLDRNTTLSLLDSTGAMVSIDPTMPHNTERSPYSVVPLTGGQLAVHIKRLAHHSSRPQWNRPQWNRPQWNRPQWNRPQWNRPQWNRPQWNRPQWNRPQWNRPQWNRPQWNRPQWNRPRDLADTFITGIMSIIHFTV